MKKNIISILALFFIATIFSQIPEKLSIDSIFNDWNSMAVPGAAISVLKDGKIIYSAGFGSADLEHDIPITPATVFYIGSTSKQFVTFCILLLEEEGKIDLDDKIQKYFPDFPEYNSPLTIRHFIHHTSGVRDYLTLMYLKGRSYLDHTEVNEVYNLIKSQSELNFSPGDRYLYSNSCYFMLALIIEKASGKSLREFAQNNIFEPLGMKSSLFYDDITDLIKNRAFSYEKSATEFNNLVSRFDLVGSSGLYSTVEDLSLWDQNFYQNKLGKGGQAIIDRMHEEGTLNSGEKSGYAFALINGTYKGLRTVSHGGALAGYRAQLLRFPEQKFSVIILANRSDANPSAKAYEIAEIFLNQMFENDHKSESKSIVEEKKDIKFKASDMEKYTGSYWNTKEYLTTKIYLENDTLRFSSGRYNERKLTPISKTEFRMQDASINLKVRFELKNDGIKSVIVTINDGVPMESIAYEPESYTKDEFKKYEGSYYSIELNVYYDLNIVNDSLMLYVNGKEISIMKSVMKNTLSNDEFGVFEFFTSSRDTIDGFRLMAGRVKNLKFEKN